jgi:hypothetical protein
VIKRCTGPHGVKVTHIPSGTEACVNIGRSHREPREITVSMIEAALTHPEIWLPCMHRL